MYGSEKSTQGIILKTNDFERPNLQQFIKNENLNHKSVLLALDQITDPQNIGSIMRSCALFNCNTLVVGKDHAPNITPALTKSASGAAEATPTKLNIIAGINKNNLIKLDIITLRLNLYFEKKLNPLTKTRL